MEKISNLSTAQQIAPVILEYKPNSLLLDSCLAAIVKVLLDLSEADSFLCLYELIYVCGYKKVGSHRLSI